MSEQERLDEVVHLGAAELEMERLLASLAPARPGLSAASVLAQAMRRADAGRRSARRQAWVWRAVAAGLAASLAISLSTRHGAGTAPPDRTTTRGVDNATAAPRVVAADPGGSPPDCSYLILRQRVLSRGMAGLPDAPSAPDRPAPLPGEDLPLERRAGDGNGA